MDVAEMLTAYFRAQGYEVAAVNWGEDAVQTAGNIHPDLVILDIRLPDIDGFEVARRLRNQQRTADIPIINEKANNDRLQGLAVGADDYVTKPISGNCVGTKRTTANGQSSLTTSNWAGRRRSVEDRLNEC
jgi:two-component system OmpR family response regulator